MYAGLVTCIVGFEMELDCFLVWLWVGFLDFFFFIFYFGYQLKTALILGILHKIIKEITKSTQMTNRKIDNFRHKIIIFRHYLPPYYCLLKDYHKFFSRI